MTDMDVSVFDMATGTITKSLVPDPGADNHVPITNGRAITSTNFLSGSQAGQEQAFIGTGDQSITIEKAQNTTIQTTYDRNVLGDHGHIVGSNELQLIVGNNSTKIDQTDITLNVNGNRIITMNGEGITIGVDQDKLIVVSADGICSSVGTDKSIIIDGEGISSQVGTDKSIVIWSEGIISRVTDSNHIHIHKSGVDILGKLVKIN